MSRKRGDWEQLMNVLEAYQKSDVNFNDISVRALSRTFHIGLMNVPRNIFKGIYETEIITDSNKDRIAKKLLNAARDKAIERKESKSKTDEKPSTLTWDIQFDGIQDKQIIDELKRRGYVIYQKIIKTELKEV